VRSGPTVKQTLNDGDARGRIVKINKLLDADAALRKSSEKSCNGNALHGWDAPAASPCDVMMHFGIAFLLVILASLAVVYGVLYSVKGRDGFASW
jgi:hypothetical protein